MSRPKREESVLERYPTLEIPRARAWRRRRWDADTLSGVLSAFCLIIAVGLAIGTELISTVVDQLGLNRSVFPEVWSLMAFVLSGLLARTNSRLRIAALGVSMFYWASITASLYLVRPLEPYLSMWAFLAITLLAGVSFQRSVATYLERRRE